jgi:hypothetical protein
MRTKVACTAAQVATVRQLYAAQQAAALRFADAVGLLVAGHVPGAFASVTIEDDGLVIPTAEVANVVDLEDVEAK